MKILIIIVSFYLLFIRCFVDLGNPFKNHLKDAMNNIKRGGRKLLEEIGLLVGLGVILLVVYVILGELVSTTIGCVWVPVLVLLWLAVRGVCAPMYFVENFSNIFRIILYIGVAILLYLGFRWIVGIFLNTDSTLSLIVFGGILIAASNFIGKVLYGALLGLVEKN